MSFKPQGKHDIVFRCYFSGMFHWQVWPSFFNRAHASLAATSESFSCGFWLFTSRFGERNLKTLQSSHEETFRKAGIQEKPWKHMKIELLHHFHQNRLVAACQANAFLQPSLLLLAETRHLYRKVSHGAHKNVPTAVPKPKIILKWITASGESIANHNLLKNHSKISPELLSLIQTFVET